MTKEEHPGDLVDEAHNPWQVLRRQPVYDNPWITIIHHDVITPSGTNGIYGLVRFKNLAVAVLPVDEAGYTWLVGQYRFPLDRYSWEIPEGGAPHGEDALTAAQRELREETGLVATHWRKILEMDLSNAVSDERSVSFIATGLTQGAAAPDETERLAIRRVPFDEVYRMVLAGEIHDALTVATVLRAKAEGLVPSA